MQLDLHTGPEEDFDITNRRQPLTLVCVDGSEESDRALRWAMRNLPDKHGLMLIHGVKIPYTACTCPGGGKRSSLAHPPTHPNH
jgi:hypothetical protein